jgi:hypothetical protein
MWIAFCSAAAPKVACIELAVTADDPRGRLYVGSEGGPFRPDVGFRGSR